MTLMITAALAILTTGAALQTPAPAAPPAAAVSTPLPVELPTVGNATVDATCGNRPALAQQAQCLATTQVAITTVVEALEQDFARQGWTPASGRENLVVYVKRRADGGCDAFQMLAFTDETRAAAPGEPAWLAFAGIPGNICVNTPAPAQ